MNSTSTRSLRRRSAAAVCGFALVAIVLGCGDSSSDDSSGETSASGETSESALAAAKQRTEELYAGTWQLPDSDGPPPQRGKNVWMISCSEAVPTCAATAAAVEEAGAALGWDVTIFDSKFDPTLFGEGVREATGAGADGILFHILDCDFAQGPLSEAKDAGIELVGIESFDCPETSPGTKPLIDVVNYVNGGYGDYVRGFGSDQAAYLIANTDGEAKVLHFTTDENEGSRLVDEGFKEQMAECGGCEVIDVPIRLADSPQQLQQRAAQALIKNPDANAAQVSYDGAITGGIGAALQASGRDLIVMGGEGQQANLDLIRRGGIQQDAGLVIPPEWEGFAGADFMNRLFAGVEQGSSGIGLQAYDADHNLPPSGPYVYDIDYAKAYEKAWASGG